MRGPLGRKKLGEAAEAFSDVPTCSIGVEPTELLANIATEARKPDGLDILPQSNLPQRLVGLKLRYILGISTGMEERLRRAGVTDFLGLWSLGAKQARAIWRSVEGERFWNSLHSHPVERRETVKRKFGHSRMLPGSWRNRKMAHVCARQLALSAARRLRRTDMRATALSLGFRSDGVARRKPGSGDDDKWRWETTLAAARDDHTFLEALAKGMEASAKTMTFRPRSVSVMLHGLEGESETTGDLFALHPADPMMATVTDGAVDHNPERWERLSDTMDELRSKMGPNAVTLGPKVDVPGGYLGGKIAFGRIPDADDFSEIRSEDADTHFCTF